MTYEPSERRNKHGLSTVRSVPTYRLHDTTGDDLGLLEHPAPNLEPGEVVVVADEREAIVTARVEAEPGPLVAMLEVAMAPSRLEAYDALPSPPDVGRAGNDPGLASYLRIEEREPAAVRFSAPCRSSPRSFQATSDVSTTLLG
jgi:hypothetical protein